MRGSGRSEAATQSTSAAALPELGCKAHGIRYAGKTAPAVEVCFTLSPEGRTWLEIGFRFLRGKGCPNPPAAVYLPGPYEGSGPARIIFDDFTARIRGAHASGVIENRTSVAARGSNGERGRRNRCRSRRSRIWDPSRKTPARRRASTTPARLPTAASRSASRSASTGAVWSRAVGASSGRAAARTRGRLRALTQATSMQPGISTIRTASAGQSEEPGHQACSRTWSTAGRSNGAPAAHRERGRDD
jgi:hypothetical protein